MSSVTDDIFLFAINLVSVLLVLLFFSYKPSNITFPKHFLNMYLFGNRNTSRNVVEVAMPSSLINTIGFNSN